MILPLSYTQVLICLAFSMVLWGSWANLQRFAGKWRYELFYWDFSFGVLLAALLAAFTLGSFNSAELTFQDNLLISSYHKIAYGLSAGVVLNLGNLLFVAALSIAPFVVVFPMAMGLSLIIGVGWTLFPAQGGLLLPMGGAVVILASLIAAGYAYSAYWADQRAVKKPLSTDPRTPSPRPAAAPPAPAKGILFSILSGIALGMAAPLVNTARSGEDGLAAYTAALMVGIATVASTPIFSPFFLVFAVHGAPVEFRAYFKGSSKQHLWGLFAGVLWCLGLLANFSSGGTLATVQAGALATRAFTAGAVLVGALWGWLKWNDLKGASYRVRVLMISMFLLWSVGAALFALAAAPK